LIAFLKALQRLKTGMAEKSSPGTRQTDGKNLVWFGEIEKNYPNYLWLPLLAVLPLNYLLARML
jgi:hypothetical protein